MPRGAALSRRGAKTPASEGISRLPYPASPEAGHALRPSGKSPLDFVARLVTGGTFRAVCRVAPHPPAATGVRAWAAT